MDKDEIEISINTNKEIKKNILEQFAIWGFGLWIGVWDLLSQNNII